MNGLYTALLVVHVLVAILGLGSLAAMAMAASGVRRAGGQMEEASAWLAPMLRYSLAGLVTMLLTGLLLDPVSGGAFHGSWWFRGSILLLAGTGALHAQARRAFRHGLSTGALAGPLLLRVERLAYAMCALIAVTTVLMEVKPF